MGDEQLDFIPLGGESDSEEEISNGSRQGDTPRNGLVHGDADDDPPWSMQNYTHREVAHNLHTEITDYVKWLRPTSLEHKQRQDLISRVRSTVKSIWSDAELCVFGSVATKLYLPNGDVDLVVLSRKGDLNIKGNLYKLARKLVMRNIAIAEPEVVSGAKVPIVKFKDVNTGIQVDICFEQDGGVRAIKCIEKWLREWPGLESLVFVVKAFLRQRNLSEVYLGGLGSFSVICMVVSFLQLHPKLATHEINEHQNLGVLLLEFFELYAFNFSYNDVTIDPRYAKYMKKPRHFFRFGQEHLLSIMDPLDDHNNISQASREILSVRAAFGDAFGELLDALYARRSDGRGVLHTILPERFNRPPLAARDHSVIYRPSHRPVEKAVRKKRNRQSAPTAGDDAASQVTFGRQVAVPRRKSGIVYGLHQNSAKDAGVVYISDDDDYVPRPFLPPKKSAPRSVSSEQVRAYWSGKGGRELSPRK